MGVIIIQIIANFYWLKRSKERRKSSDNTHKEFLVELAELHEEEFRGPSGLQYMGKVIVNKRYTEAVAKEE
jgi:hypothetical protein